MNISTEEFEAAQEEYAGYCQKCDAITTESGVEPDAEKYHCPECETNSIMGVENALVMGLIDIEED